MPFKPGKKIFSRPLSSSSPLISMSFLEFYKKKTKLIYSRFSPIQTKMYPNSFDFWRKVKS